MDCNLNPSNFSRDLHGQRISKMNKVVSQIEGNDEEEDNPYQFQDDVLACLRELQHLAETIKERADTMEYIIRRFKATVHGEDIDD